MKVPPSKWAKTARKQENIPFQEEYDLLAGRNVLEDGILN
jgi:hypothetical protein